MEEEKKEDQPQSKAVEKGLVEEFIGDVISLERGLPLPLSGL